MVQDPQQLVRTTVSDQTVYTRIDKKAVLAAANVDKKMVGVTNMPSTKKCHFSGLVTHGKDAICFSSEPFKASVSLQYINGNYLSGSEAKSVIVKASLKVARFLHDLAGGKKSVAENTDDINESYDFCTGPIYTFMVGLYLLRGSSNLKVRICLESYNGKVRAFENIIVGDEMSSILKLVGKQKVLLVAALTRFAILCKNFCVPEDVNLVIGTGMEAGFGEGTVTGSIAPRLPVVLENDDISKRGKNMHVLYPNPNPKMDEYAVLGYIFGPSLSPRTIFEEGYRLQMYYSQIKDASRIWRSAGNASSYSKANYTDVNRFLQQVNAFYDEFIHYSTKWKQEGLRVRLEEGRGVSFSEKSNVHDIFYDTLTAADERYRNTFYSVPIANHITVSTMMLRAIKFRAKEIGNILTTSKDPYVNLQCKYLMNECTSYLKYFYSGGAPVRGTFFQALLNNRMWRIILAPRIIKKIQLGSDNLFNRLLMVLGLRNIVSPEYIYQNRKGLYHDKTLNINICPICWALNFRRSSTFMHEHICSRSYEERKLLNAEDLSSHRKRVEKILKDREMTLNIKQKLFFEAAMEGDSSILFLGSGGTGKSYVLDLVVYAMRVRDGLDSVVLLGYTKSIALRSGGVTIHHFFGFEYNVDLNILDSKLIMRSFSVDMVDKLSCVHNLIIEESQHITSKFIKFLDEIFRLLHNSTSDFGGVVCIFCGDPLQLGYQTSADSSSYVQSEAVLNGSFRGIC